CIIHTDITHRRRGGSQDYGPVFCLHPSMLKLMSRRRRSSPVKIFSQCRSPSVAEGAAVGLRNLFATDARQSDSRVGAACADKIWERGTHLQCVASGPQSFDPRGRHPSAPWHLDILNTPLSHQKSSLYLRAFRSTVSASDQQYPAVARRSGCPPNHLVRGVVQRSEHSQIRALGGHFAVG
ncbi:unnamed protein product, partial [Ectocarpus sp. 6 AP-2014]